MIDFSQDRWDGVRETYAAWWNGTLKRPIIKATFQREYDFPIAMLSQQNCHRTELPARDVIEGIHAHLE
ncbi:MAG: hypothetical protein LBH54_00725, partial [Clostridiales bacterium]|nr:hypothetical protein [Clostridiales bacterium]